MSKSQEAASECVKSLTDVAVEIQHDWENPVAATSLEAIYGPLIVKLGIAERCVATIKDEIKNQLYINCKL